FPLEAGLLHQPMGEPAQEVGVRSAALIAARPQPGMVGQQHADAALAALADNQERLVLRALHQHLAVTRADIDHAEPMSPSGIWTRGARRFAGHWRLLAKLGEARLEWLLDHAP